MTFAVERRQIIDMCLRLQDMAYFLGTWGNVSMRVGDKILLTPSRVSYEQMKPDDIVVIDLAGNKVEGERNPTSEKEVHRKIYEARSDVHAVIHAHTKSAMAASVLEIDEVPCVVEEMSQLLGGSIPITEQYVKAEDHAQLGAVAASALKDRKAVILRNHGPVACGATLEEALLAVRVQEKACQLYLQSASTGHTIRKIPTESVASEHYRYLYTYGKEST